MLNSNTIVINPYILGRTSFFKEKDIRLNSICIENPNGRWRKFTKDEVYSRDQLKLDFKWIVSEEDDDRTLAEMISQIKEESANIAKAVAELEKLIGEVDE